MKCALKSHLLRHHEGKPVICGICQNTFSSKFSLQLHSYSHTGERLFVCEVCKKGFKGITILRQHLRVHTGGERPFECDVCQKRFSCRAALKTHHLAHTESYFCNESQKQCISKRSLQLHLKTHSNEKNYYVCEICEKTYTTRSSLDKHYLKHPEKNKL